MWRNRESNHTASQAKSSCSQHILGARQAPVINPFIFILFSQGIPLEGETQKRQRILEIRDQEGGRKCLSPSIFRKNKAFLLGGSLVQSLQVATPHEFSSKGAPVGGKKSDGAALIKDFSAQDLDINQCLDSADVQRKY
jgi:hypothetical protein